MTSKHGDHWSEWSTVASRQSSKPSSSDGKMSGRWPHSSELFDYIIIIIIIIIIMLQYDDHRVTIWCPWGFTHSHFLCRALSNVSTLSGRCPMLVQVEVWPKQSRPGSKFHLLMKKGFLPFAKVWRENDGGQPKGVRQHWDGGRRHWCERGAGPHHSTWIFVGQKYICWTKIFAAEL